jgi:broad specificity phosphatase PhoE
MPIYFIRHGQSEFNARFDGNRDPMIFDAPLTQLGIEQALAAKEKISEMKISHVITSPLTRAIQTSLHIFGDATPITVSIGHHEYLLHSCDVGRSPKKLKNDFPNLDFDHLDERWWHHHSGETGEIAVEPVEVFENRIASFVQSLDVISTMPLAIVGHGNAFKQIIGRMMENCEIHRFS